MLGLAVPDGNRRSPRNATRFSSATARSLIVDKKSFLYLNGSELDYGEELMSSGFKVVNPNAKRSADVENRSSYERVDVGIMASR